MKISRDKNVTSERDRARYHFYASELILRDHFLYLGASLYRDASKLILAATPHRAIASAHSQKSETTYATTLNAETTNSAVSIGREKR